MVLTVFEMKVPWRRNKAKPPSTEAGGGYYWGDALSDSADSTSSSFRGNDFAFQIDHKRSHDYGMDRHTADGTAHGGTAREDGSGESPAELGRCRQVCRSGHSRQ